MGRALSNEEIAELMAPKKKKSEEKPPVVRFPAPPQHGPLRYVEVSSLCVVAGYWSYPENNEEKVWVKTKGGCRTQTNYRVNGIPMCCTHALRTLNDMLIEENYDVKEYIMTPDEAAQAEIIALKESESNLIKVNDQLLRRLEAEAA